MNNNVREGLRKLAALVESGGSADIMGYEQEQLDAEGRKTWDQVLTAVAWIWSLPPDSASRIVTKP